ncbi:MAG: DNA methyltransferase [Thalassovita sp.]
MAVYSRFTDIPQFKYGLIMADNPWSFDNWSAAGEKKNPKSKYDCMTLEDIKALRVGDLAAKDCALWLWATNPMLPQAVEVLTAWGFTFKTAGHWAKMTQKSFEMQGPEKNIVHGKQSFGPGYLFRCAGEPYLLGTVGKPKQMFKNIRSVIIAPAREHSRKPDKAYAEAERMFGDVPKLDLFSREVRPGWDAFGNEVGKFEGAA